MSQIPPQWCQTDNQRQHYQEHKLYETMRSTSLEEDVVEYMKFSEETFGTPEIKQTDEKVSAIWQHMEVRRIIFLEEYMLKK